MSFPLSRECHSQSWQYNSKREKPLIIMQIKKLSVTYEILTESMEPNEPNLKPVMAVTLVTHMKLNFELLLFKMKI